MDLLFKTIHYIFRPVNETGHPLPVDQSPLDRPRPPVGRQRPAGDRKPRPPVVTIDHYDHPDYVPMPKSNVEPKETINDIF